MFEKPAIWYKPGRAPGPKAVANSFRREESVNGNAGAGSGAGSQEARSTKLAMLFNKPTLSNCAAVEDSCLTISRLTCNNVPSFHPLPEDTCPLFTCPTAVHLTDTTTADRGGDDYYFGEYCCRDLKGHQSALVVLEPPANGTATTKDVAAASMTTNNAIRTGKDDNLNDAV
ncbi:hypothetical protein EXIGLDRAFT_691190 [Exidia glandulosa HHB12029]|uniref:Uncharacterized protein n=1 Tax=Exidia glandulosa HHB12029 TaxID=1314781 RepID=A0A165IUM9_EXIGL|nr:hypothetical protein EXIGLDRAFT_691190 [Exidia glandulosa HHB12029]